jgi:hypothetical protein
MRSELPIMNGYADCGRMDFDGCDPAMSISGWIRPAASTSKERIIIAKTAGIMAQHYYWMAGLNVENRMIFRLKTTTGGTRTLLSESSVTGGEWTHFAATWDGDSMRLYINGEPDSGAAKGGLPGRNSTLRAYIGNGNFGTRPFNGMISGLKLFNIPLDHQDILNEYTLNRETYAEPEPDEPPPDDDPPANDDPPPDQDPPGDDDPATTVIPAGAGFPEKPVVYSLPRSGILTVSGARNGSLLHIYDLPGRIIQNALLADGLNNIPLQIKNTGVYIYLIRHQAGFFSGRVYIQN